MLLLILASSVPAVSVVLYLVWIHVRIYRTACLGLVASPPLYPLRILDVYPFKSLRGALGLVDRDGTA